jgi:epoxyqueuosine reductase
MTFQWHGRSLPGIVPSTYCHEIDRQVTNLLEEVLSPAGFSLFRRPLPEKLLAVQSGLAKYGKNNLAFVEGMGSYCSLMGFYTDLPDVDTGWAEPAVMEQCERCTTCLKKCPTEAIPDDRFLIRAERCLTFHNERQQDFPDWVDSKWHHCLVGCLYCQAFCSVNRKVNVPVENNTTFSEAETELILRGATEDELPGDTRRKLEPVVFFRALPELARNLRMLVDYPENADRGWDLIKNSAT